MTHLVALKYSRETSENMPFRTPSVPIKDPLIDFYLDWVNNYLTIAKMAENYRITENQCGDLINIGRDFFERQKRK